MYDREQMGFPRITRTTKVLVGLVAGLSILAALLKGWIGSIDLLEWAAFQPNLVLGGQVWRLVTWPWLATDPFGLIFGVLGLYFFGSACERAWGRRSFLFRLGVFVVVPVMLTMPIVFAPGAAARVGAIGPSVLVLALLAAYAADHRRASIVLFPIPFRLNGDMILWFEGGLLALYVLFSGTILPYLPQIAAFGLALAWFRFDLLKGLRRRWLQLRRRRIEANLRKLKGRHLSVVKDDDEPPTYLH